MVMRTSNVVRRTYDASSRAGNATRVEVCPPIRCKVICSITFGGTSMKRNVIRLTLGLAALAVVLVGLESQADAFGRRGGRHHGGHSSCNSSCQSSCQESSCESSCAAPSDCGCESNGCGKSRGHRKNKGCGCDSGCNSGGCDSGCNGGRHHGRRHSGCNGGGCNGGGCNGGGGCGCDGGGEVIHEGKAGENGQQAPPAPEENAPQENDAEGQAPSA
jgi:hypothetical protein